MNMLGSSWKNVLRPLKTMVVDRKKQQALALLYLALGTLQNAANSSVVPTEFAAEPTTKMIEVLEDKFSNLNFSPSTKSPILPSPSPRVCVGVRTLTSQPNFLTSIGYQVCLVMVLHWPSCSVVVIVIVAVVVVVVAVVVVVVVLRCLCSVSQAGTKRVL